MKNNVLIVSAKFNEMVVEPLVQGALTTLKNHGFADDQIDMISVPGAFEIPSITARAARMKKHQAIICLGAVIRGETPHFEHVAGPCASGLMNVSIETGIPIIFGVLTTDTIEQALNRAGLKYGNKGSEAAAAALSMMQVVNTVDQWGKN